jgi:Domain of unknown function (DUF3786)/Putative Fe-S cluster
MPPFNSLMDVFKLLERSNCSRCGEKTCMAFAAKVFQGSRPLADCPFIAPETAQMYGLQPQKRVNNEPEIDEQMAALRAQIKAVDLAEAARRIGAAFDGTRLTLKIMGKDFRLDAEGKAYTDIHINPWVLAPILNYVIHCKGTPVKGEWVPLRELPGGKDWYRLFAQRCEKPMKKVADSYSDLFVDLVDIFNGRSVDNHYQSDVALVLHPLPLVPLLICYWHPEADMGSELNLFFDASAEDNLGIDGIFSLGTGITRMFEKLAVRHGGAAAN